MKSIILTAALVLALAIPLILFVMQTAARVTHLLGA